MHLKKILILLTFLVFTISSNAEEIKHRDLNTEFNVYTGMFDFSDDGKKSELIGFQHQNENLNRDTFLGNLSHLYSLDIANIDIFTWRCNNPKKTKI